MKIVVYSTPSCPYCTLAKDYLRKKSVTFDDVDVSRDARRAEEMVRKSGQMGVPVLDINGKVLVGFSAREIDRALAV